MVFSHAAAASSKVISSSYWRSSPRRARVRPPRAAARAEEVAEEVAEDVVEAGARSRSRRPALLERGVPEAVVLRAPLGVAEDLVGLAELLEALLGLPCRRDSVRMVLERELAVGLLELVVARRP